MRSPAEGRPTPSLPVTSSVTQSPQQTGSAHPPVGLSQTSGPLLRLPDEATVRQIFHLKYGREQDLGWGPRLRRSFGYYNPDDWYEALLASLVCGGMHWLDVGCGRDLFPSNRALASELSQRAGRLVGLDPDPTLDDRRGNGR